MTLGKQNFVNPGAILAALVDDNNMKFQVGQGEDIREFNDILLGRIKDAFVDLKVLHNNKEGQEN